MSIAPHYRSWSDRLRSPWAACWPIAWASVRMIGRRKLFWLLLGLALVNFLFLFAAIYLKAQVVAERPEIGRFVDRVLRDVSGTGRTYLVFMRTQGTVTMLVLAFAGELLVGGDFYQGGLRYYLARRIARRHYVAGKLLAIATLVSLITTVPALVLYAEYGLLTDSTVYFRENGRILAGILGYGAIMAGALAAVLFAVAAWLQRTVPLAAAWASLFVLLPAVGEILRETTGQAAWRLLDFWRNISQLGGWCFGAQAERDAELLLPAAVVVAAVSAFSILVALPRVRAVQAVS